MSSEKGTAFPRGPEPQSDVQADAVKDRVGERDAEINVSSLPDEASVTGQGGSGSNDNDSPPTALEAALQRPLPEPAFRAGDRVSIFRLLLFRYPLIEGQAVVVAPVPGHAHEYVVRFAGDARLRRRFVLPGDFQRAPEATLEALRAVWRAGIDPAIAEEFFADLEAANDNGEGK